MKAYEECLSETTTAHAPWYIIPADDKPSARLLVSDAITRLLQDLKLKYPEMGPTHQQELQQIRTQLLQENQESS
jgi:hypothetical protein